jgi:hypothetical protein
LTLFACVIVFVAGVVHRALSQTSQPEGLAVQGEEPPQRYITYVCDEERGPTFDLNGPSATMRVISFLHHPEKLGARNWDPSRRFQYGLRFIVRESDTADAVYSRDVWFVTRKSKGAFTGREWSRESAYYPVGETGEPLDPRLLDIDLSAHAAQGRVLEIRTISPGDEPVEASVVAFKAFRRPDARIDWMHQTLDPSRMVELSERSQIASWSVPTDDEIRKMLEAGWRRLSTLGSPPVRILYSTGFRLQTSEQVSFGEAISPSRGVAYNLRGPATLRLAVWSNQPNLDLRTFAVSSTGDDVAAEDRVQTVRARRTMGELIEPDGPVASVDVPDGAMQTIWVWSESGEGRVLASVSAAEAPVGEHAMLMRDDDVLVRPDFVEFSSWQLGGTPLRYQLREGDLRAGDAVLVTARRAAGTDPRPIYYRFDGDDEIGQLPNDGEPSRFEIASPPGASDETPPQSLSEPTYSRLWIPEGARSLSVWGAADQWVSVSVISIGRVPERQLREPYDVAPRGLRWRYAPYARHPWHSIAPEDTRRLAARGRRWRVRAQARWEPDIDAKATAEALRRTDLFEAPEAESSPAGPAEVLTPTQTARSDVLLERASSVDAPAWDSTHRVRVRSNRGGVTCTTSDSRVGLVVHAPGDLGGSYTVTWNDIPLRRRMVRTRTDRFTIDVPSDEGRLEVSTEGRAPVEAWADCVPAKLARADVWRLRRTYPMRHDRPLEFRVHATPDETWYVNFVAYGPSEGEIEATFDDGTPARREGIVEQLTFPTRSFDWTSAALDTRMASRPNARLSTPILFSVPVGSDLAPGAHTIRLRWKGAPDETVSIRAFRYGR